MSRHCAAFGCVQPGDHHVTWPGMYTGPDGEAWMCRAHAHALLVSRDEVRVMTDERRQELGDRYAREALIAAEAHDDV